MAYGRYNNYGGNSYRRGGGYNQNSGYNQGGGYQRPSQPKKRSGCSLRIMEDGSPILSGWKLSGRDMISMYARPYSKSKKVTSKTGIEWINLFVTLTNKSTMQITKCGGLFNKKTGKLYISELNLIANPKAPRGGYFGKHISSNYNK